MIAHQSLTMGVLLIISSLGAGAAWGNHQQIATTAHRLENQSHAFARDVARVFRDSRLAGAMYRTACDISDKAAEIEFQARTGVGCGLLRRDLECIQRDLVELCRLVDSAENRALRGWDPPICGCVDTLRSKLEAMNCTAGSLERMLDNLDRPVRVGRGSIPSFGPTGGYDYGFDDRRGNNSPSIDFGVGNSTFRISLGGNDPLERPSGNVGNVPRGGSVSGNHGRNQFDRGSSRGESEQVSRGSQGNRGSSRGNESRSVGSPGTRNQNLVMTPQGLQRGGSLHPDVQLFLR